MATEHRMKTCGDCIHAELCEHNTGVPLFNPANEAYCRAFKDKDNFAEVIRCKDCKHSGLYEDGTVFCKLHSERGEHEERHGSYSVWMEPDDFCSYGEKG